MGFSSTDARTSTPDNSSKFPLTMPLQDVAVRVEAKINGQPVYRPPRRQCGGGLGNRPALSRRRRRGSRSARAQGRARPLSPAQIVGIPPVPLTFVAAGAPSRVAEPTSRSIKSKPRSTVGLGHCGPPQPITRGSERKPKPVYEMVGILPVPPIYSIYRRNLGILNHHRIPFPACIRSSKSSRTVRRSTQKSLPYDSR